MDSMARTTQILFLRAATVFRGVITAISYGVLLYGIHGFPIDMSVCVSNSFVTCTAVSMYLDSGLPTYFQMNSIYWPYFLFFAYPGWNFMASDFSTMTY